MAKKIKIELPPLITQEEGKKIAKILNESRLSGCISEKPKLGCMSILFILIVLGTTLNYIL